MLAGVAIAATWRGPRLRSFRRDTRHRYWLLLQRPQPDVCVHDPGYDVDVEVRAEPEALPRACLGQLPLAGAVKDGRIELTGASHLRRALSEWLGVTRFEAMAAR